MALLRECLSQLRIQQGESDFRIDMNVVPEADEMDEPNSTSWQFHGRLGDPNAARRARAAEFYLSL
jgi:hypothetical protein